MNTIETGKNVLAIEAGAIQNAIPRIDGSFEKAVTLMFQSAGRVVVTGMGKSGLIGRKIAATLTSTGTPAVFLHPAEALHGDIGIIFPQDTVLALSTSGETEEVLRILNYIKRLGIPLISLVGDPASTLARESDVFIDCSVSQEACQLGLVPTASSTLTLAVGDALAVALMARKGIGEDDFRQFHPGGTIGKKLLKVRHLMHTGGQMPLVTPDAHMNDVIRVINEKRFGVAVVAENDRVAGIITDGDLRRLLLRGIDFPASTARECMTPTPLCIDENKLATEALKIMEERSITSLIVVKEQDRLCGLLHLHDLWRTEMI